ncbi:caspase recruitment domain-containing protein 19 isoform X2 [Oryzias melastigma]|uniref:Caspase recruitment domain-containing protein 19-like n=2 Tax=Oryzias melastigma TaxID=30732 RepID=A0A3B3DAT3_ORYME|nr:caspase recruitment domain-containing protein 19 isoform X1 [Oryzias melastigma]XP_024147944.1 caspase recruitment domain-containing protein 19 isoform X2 [Oryzias melastigma]
MVRLKIMDAERYDEQLQKDAPFLCSDQRMDAELVDRLVLQLNRVYPQILSDKEACKFRSLSVPAKEQLHGLLKHLHGKGEESCLEFYQALHIHAEDIYRNLPTRTRQREMADSNWSNSLAPPPESYALNDKGPAFFLSCFSFVAGLAILYYYGEVKTLRGSGAFLQCSAAGFSKNAKDVFIFYTEDGHKKIMKLL